MKKKKSIFQIAGIIISAPFYILYKLFNDILDAETATFIVEVGCFMLFL